MVIVLAIAPKVHGFKSGQCQWIFKGDKIPYHDFLRRGSIAVDPMSKEDTCRQNSRTFLAKFLPASLLDVSAATREENSGG
jgi:hypothetical protein